MSDLMRTRSGKKYKYVSCVRCPQEFKYWFTNSRPALCRDCRFSVSVVERRTIWEVS